MQVVFDILTFNFQTINKKLRTNRKNKKQQIAFCDWIELKFNKAGYKTVSIPNLSFIKTFMLFISFCKIFAAVCLYLFIKAVSLL